MNVVKNERVMIHSAYQFYRDLHVMNKHLDYDGNYRKQALWYVCIFSVKPLYMEYKYLQKRSKFTYMYLH